MCLLVTLESIYSLKLLLHILQDLLFCHCLLETIYISHDNASLTYCFIVTAQFFSPNTTPSNKDIMLLLFTRLSSKLVFTTF